MAICLINWRNMTGRSRWNGRIKWQKEIKETHLFLHEGTASKAEPSVWRLPGARASGTLLATVPEQVQRPQAPCSSQLLTHERRAPMAGSLCGDSQFPPHQMAPSLSPSILCSIPPAVLEERPILPRLSLNLPGGLSLRITSPFCIKSSTFLFLWAFASYMKMECSGPEISTLLILWAVSTLAFA